MDIDHAAGHEAPPGSSQRLVRREGRGATGYGHLLVTSSGGSALRRKVQKIIRALERAYGRPVPEAPGESRDPLSELIFTILSQNTSDLNRDRAWASLWRMFGSWREVASAPRRSLERAIKVGGLARTKSKVIHEVLRRIEREVGDYSLENLRSMSMEGVEAYLCSFKGVGLKTIRCVQVFSLAQPAFPVDTHILRITKRLGLVPDKASPEAAHRVMQLLTPASEVLPFHINLITHGRRVCKAARPRCEECVIRRWCLYYRECKAAIASVRKRRKHRRGGPTA